jgi:DNA ligase-1
MTRTIKPMLAATYGEDVKVLTFPLLGSPKIDGIRALIVDGVVQSRSGKPIPCPTVQRLLGRPELEGLDGELAVGPTYAKDLMQRTMSGVMSKSEMEPEELMSFSFNVFDKWDAAGRYDARLSAAMTQVALAGIACVRSISHVECKTQPDVLEFEAACLGSGYEGIMLNRPDSAYKNGRAGKTAKSELIKVKRFTDDEAIVVGATEMMHNDNEAFTDELGRTKRSTAKEGKRPAGVLGAFRLRAVTGRFAGVEFDCSGFTAEQRKAYWADRDAWLGALVKFKHFDITGAVDAPRIPIFLGKRSPLDT